MLDDLGSNMTLVHSKHDLQQQEGGKCDNVEEPWEVGRPTRQTAP